VGADVFMLQMWSFASCFEFLRNEKIVILFKMKEHMKLQRNRKNCISIMPQKETEFHMVEFSNFPNPPKGAGKELCFWGYYLYQGVQARIPL